VTAPAAAEELSKKPQAGAQELQQAEVQADKRELQQAGVQAEVHVLRMPYRIRCRKQYHQDFLYRN
jgi:hypothetical protein